MFCTFPYLVFGFNSKFIYQVLFPAEIVRKKISVTESSGSGQEMGESKQSVNPVI